MLNQQTYTSCFEYEKTSRKVPEISQNLFGNSGSYQSLSIKCLSFQTSQILCIAQLLALFEVSHKLLMMSCKIYLISRLCTKSAFTEFTRNTLRLDQDANESFLHDSKICRIIEQIERNTSRTAVKNKIEKSN